MWNETVCIAMKLTNDILDPQKLIKCSTCWCHAFLNQNAGRLFRWSAAYPSLSFIENMNRKPYKQKKSVNSHRSFANWASLLSVQIVSNSNGHSMLDIGNVMAYVSYHLLPVRILLLSTKPKRKFRMANASNFVWRFYFTTKAVINVASDVSHGFFSMQLYYNNEHLTSSVSDASHVLPLKRLCLVFDSQANQVNGNPYRNNKDIRNLIPLAMRTTEHCWLLCVLVLMRSPYQTDGKPSDTKAKKHITDSNYIRLVTVRSTTSSHWKLQIQS